MSFRFGQYIMKSGATGLINSVGSAIISIGSIPLILANIGIEKYGVWALLTIFIGIPAITDLGVSKSLVYFIAKKPDKDNLNQVYTIGLLFNIFIISLVSLIGAIVYLLDFNVWGASENLDYPLGKKVFINGIFITVCMIATGFCRSVFEGVNKIHYVNISYFLQTLLYYSVALIVTCLTKNIESLILSTSVVYFAIFVLSFITLKYRIGATVVVLSMSALQEILRKSMSFFSISICSIILHPMNRYLLMIFSGNTALYGIFDIAIKIASAASSCLQVFATPVFSVFSGYGMARIKEIRTILTNYLIWLSVAYIIGCVLFFVLGSKILIIFRVNDQETLFFVSFIMLIGFASAGVAEPFVRTLWALGYLRSALKINIIAPIINFSGLFIFFAFPPLYRVGISYSLAYLGTSILFLLFTLRKLSI